MYQTKTKTTNHNPAPGAAKSTEIPSFPRLAAGKRQESTSPLATRKSLNSHRNPIVTRKFAHRKNATTVWQNFRKHLSDAVFLIRFTAEYGGLSKYNPPSDVKDMNPAAKQQYL